jgi:hypothetical protein
MKGEPIDSAKFDRGSIPAALTNVPHAYCAGYRLVSEARALWDAFQDAHDTARFTFELELPMKYFTQAVELVLIKNAEHDRLLQVRTRVLNQQLRHDFERWHPQLPATADPVRQAA